MNKTDQAYVAQRAEALAIVYLTRRPDLMITPPGEADGLDLVVHLRKDSQRTTRIFGIQIQGRRTLNGTASNAEGEWKFPDIHNPLSKTVSIPACVFLFVMDTDQGFYKWLQEPIVTAQGEAELRMNQRDVFRILDNDSLGSIVAQVNHWYEVKDSHPQPYLVTRV